MKFAQISDVREAKLELSNRLSLARDELSFKESIDKLNNKIITNKEISRRSGISASYVDGIMAGDNIPSLTMFFKIVTTLEKDTMKMVEGLERFVKPKDINIVSGDSLEEVKYLKLFKMKLDKYLSTLGEVKKSKIILVPTDERYLEVRDNSMEALGMVKGSTVYWKKDLKTLINGRLYVVNVDGEIMIRKVWIIKDRILLIPCALNLDYEVEEYSKLKVNILGIPLTVKKML